MNIKAMLEALNIDLTEVLPEKKLLKLIVKAQADMISQYEYEVSALKTRIEGCHSGSSSLESELATTREALSATQERLTKIFISNPFLIPEEAKATAPQGMGGKINAIRIVRQACYCSLYEAKQIVEAHIATVGNLSSNC
jgi:ribosomal protein L7/L12